MERRYYGIQHILRFVLTKQSSEEEHKYNGKICLFVLPTLFCFALKKKKIRNPFLRHADGRRFQEGRTVKNTKRNNREPEGQQEDNTLPRGHWKTLGSGVLRNRKNKQCSALPFSDRNGHHRYIWTMITKIKTVIIITIIITRPLGKSAIFRKGLRSSNGGNIYIFIHILTLKIYM